MTRKFFRCRPDRRAARASTLRITGTGLPRLVRLPSTCAEAKGLRHRARGVRLLLGGDQESARSAEARRFDRFLVTAGGRLLPDAE